VKRPPRRPARAVRPAGAGLRPTACHSFPGRTSRSGRYSTVRHRSFKKIPSQRNDTVRGSSLEGNQWVRPLTPPVGDTQRSPRRPPPAVPHTAAPMALATRKVNRPDVAATKAKGETAC
jgi:hypothetical protein